VAGGTSVRDLAGTLLGALDPDAQNDRAREKHQLPPDQAPTEKQRDQAQDELLRLALRPFHDPKLRDRLANVRRSLEQLIDEVSQDQLLQAGFDATALQKAQALVDSFRAFIDSNRDELEAIRVFYSRPRRLGLRFRHVKELAEALKRPPVSATPERIWSAFQAVEPQSVKGRCGKLVDVIALVRHALEPASPLEPFKLTVEERYRAWLAEREASGAAFGPEQRKWLDAIKDHIASSLAIEADDFDLAPFAQLGGLGRAHELFGDRLAEIMDDLNLRLAA
jgi:type I restriction enzyme R subunit